MSKPFIYEIESSSEESHQTSPSWMLTFVRWANRDPSNFTNSEEAGGDLAVTEPLVVINDCISVSVHSSKSSHTPSMTAILKGGDINYLTAVAPGDFVFVNIANWSKTIDDAYARAKASKPINKFKDGFKGYFKVQSVRRVLGTNPSTGAKEFQFQIDGYGFTEFNNKIYFNSHLIPPGTEKSHPLYITNLSKVWHDLFTNKGLPDVQDVIRFFIATFLGDGQPAEGTNKLIKESGAKAQLTPNSQFYVPSGVGALLGQSKAKAAKDLYVYLMGIQEYSSGSQKTPERSLIPQISSVKDGRFFYTSKKCQGVAYVKPDYWNQVPVWSILEQYLNSPINEMYVCYRPSPLGSVMPTLVMRQIPLSSERYKGIGTKFLSLPRWKISPDLIYDINLGRDEAARFNFVQVFGSMPGTSKPELTISYQIAQQNTVSDDKDIKRSGLRPYVVTSNFDPPANGKFFTRALEWKELLGDILIGGHLKMNGSITCVGIEAPIAPGDNLELENVVYHIESVVHTASIQANGQKLFRTMLELSNGVSVLSNPKKNVYPQMNNTKMALEQESNFDDSETLPGITDAQTVYPDPFFDTKAKSNNRGFDLPPKSFGPAKKQSKPKGKARGSAK